MAFQQNPAAKIICTGCNAENYAIVTFAGDSRANRDLETGECVACNTQIISERCFGIFVGATAEAAQGALTAFQKGASRSVA